MSQGSRRERVADLLRSELSELLTRTVKDPGMGFVTLTRVDLTADLQHARVYYTCIGCLLYTSPSPRDLSTSRMPSSA